MLLRCGDVASGLLLRLSILYVPSSISAMIRVDALTKCYGPLTAVDGLTCQVAPGEVYALLGPNGAGKTTALRCLATLLGPNSGSASVFGFDVVQDPIEARRQMAFLAASMGLYERLTAREMVEYFGRLHGMGRTRSVDASMNWSTCSGSGTSRIGSVDASPPVKGSVCLWHVRSYTIPWL